MQCSSEPDCGLLYVVQTAIGRVVAEEAPKMLWQRIVLCGSVINNFLVLY